MQSSVVHLKTAQHSIDRNNDASMQERENLVRLKEKEIKRKEEIITKQITDLQVY